MNIICSEIFLENIKISQKALEEKLLSTYSFLKKERREKFLFNLVNSDKEEFTLVIEKKRDILSVIDIIPGEIFVNRGILTTKGINTKLSS